MSERIDFTDRGIISVYQDVAEGNVNALVNFLDSMENICRRHSYKPLVDFTNSVIRFYEEDFRGHVMSCFENWKNSDFSLDRLAKRCGAGEGAANTGRRYMEELRDNLEGMFQRHFSNVRMDTDQPVLDENDILQTNEEIRRLINQAGVVRDRAVAQCNIRQDQNMLYSLITPVVKNTGDSMCECFRSIIAKVMEGSELYARGVRATVNSVHTGALLDEADFSWPAYDDFY